MANKGLAARQVGRTGSLRGSGRERPIGEKSIGLFTYDKTIDNGCIGCEVRVFPLLVKHQSDSWPEIEERAAQWVAPERALALIKESELKLLVAAFVQRVALAARKSTP